MAHNQNTNTIPVVEMDSRKFLGALNKSAQARVVMFESLIKDMASKSNQNWRLSALNTDTIIIENVDSKEYYIADHSQAKGGRITIDNFRKIEVVEKDKKAVFKESCSQLVDAIEENDRKGMQIAFNKLAAQRFSPRTVPQSGYVVTRDGVTRQITTKESGKLTNDDKSRIIKAIVESLQTNTVIAESGRITGKFGPAVKIKLPVTEWTCKKVIGRFMRDTAKNAYQHPGFQNRIAHVAKLVNNKKFEEAKQSISGFLREQQEFCMLNSKQTQSLINDTLAAKGIFNQSLCDAVSDLFITTNLTENRAEIVKEWTNTAKKVSNVSLLENVQILENAKNFKKSYDAFLTKVFNEAVSPRQVMVDAYKTALSSLRNSPQIQEVPDIAGKIDSLVTRLSESEVDHSVIAEVEDVLAGAKSELDAANGLDNFDSMPGVGSELPADVSSAMAPKPDAQKKDGVSIIINSPLVNVGNQSSEEDDMGMDDLPPPPDMNDGADIDLDDSGLEDDEESDGDVDSIKNELDSLGGDEDKVQLGDLGESVDPYDFDITVNEAFGTDYGTSAITDKGDIEILVNAMLERASGMDENAIQENASAIALDMISEAGITIPENRQEETVEFIANEFLRRLGQLGEGQFKWGTKKQRTGLKKNRIKESKANSNIVWESHDEQAQGIAGSFDGVKFTVDYADPPVLLGNNSINDMIPIPESLVPEIKTLISSRKAANLEKWIKEGIEQLRPDSDDENAQLDEAVATIRSTIDGGLEIEVDSEEEVGVQHNADQMLTDDGLGMEDGMEGDEIEGAVGAELGGEEAGIPVETDNGIDSDQMNDIDGIEDTQEHHHDDIPDFEGDIETGEDEPEAEDEEEELGESVENDEVVSEDNEITEPTKGKYTKLADEDPRKTASATKPKESGEDLKGFDKKKDQSTKVDSKFTKVKPGKNAP